jgi:16S rRNA G966 N2-methylase RsmD
MNENANRQERLIDPRELKPHPKNPNARHDVSGIARSIQTHGFCDPIIALPDLTILSGHGRHQAALQLGLERVPVVTVEMSDADALSFMLAANKLAEKSRRDDAKVADILRELHESFDRSLTGLQSTGYETADIEALLGLSAGNPHGAPDADEDPGPPPAEPQTVLGELVQLGPHRLICGDSTDPHVWDRLMEGDARKLDAVITDPPYGIAYQSGMGKQPKAEIANDGNLEVACRVMTDALSLARAHSIDGAACYVFAGGGGPINVVGPVWDTLAKVGDVTNLLIWDKRECKGLSWRWRYSYETCFEVRFGDKFAHWYGGRAAGNVLHHNKVIPRGGDHPTPKPVPMLIEILDAVTPRGGLVADCFGGSGSTLVAAARLGRVARIVELDPGYCDLIRRRWARLQGVAA